MNNRLPDFIKDYLSCFDQTWTDQTLAEDIRFVVLDSETTGLDPHTSRLRLLQLATEQNSYIFDCFRLSREQLAPLLEVIAADQPIKIAHNAKFDWKFLRRHLGIRMNGIFDTYLASVLISAYAGALEAFPALADWVGPAMSTSVHYGLLSGFFTLIYKWLPAGGVSWRYALIGGAVNALLFAAGNRALVFYFEVTQLTSAFGATAGFAAIMVWMYWTSLTILIGAQVGRSARDVLIENRSREMVEGDL